MDLMIAALIGGAVGAALITALMAWNKKAAIRLRKNTLANLKKIATEEDDGSALEAKKLALELEDLTSKIKDEAKGLKA